MKSLHFVFLHPSNHSKRIFLFFAAILLSLASFPSNAQTLGRLFFTPEQRQALDHQRQIGIEKLQEVPEDPLLTINGVVTRSSGRKTIWINGVTQHDNDAGNGVAVVPVRQNSGRVTLQTSESPITEVRVGNTVNFNTGETGDLLGEGTITRHQRRNK